MNTIRADISGVFSSIQGEGLFIGAKQIFIRLRSCNLACSFCDEGERGQAKDYTPLELITEIKYLDMNKGPHHSVSLTGGEPLMYVDYLIIFLKLLRKNGMKVYLETNGTLPEALACVIDQVDIIAMDFKLPSSANIRPYWDEHFEFLKIAVKKNVFVKAVVTRETTKEDVVKAVSILKRLKKDVPFVLQPATPRSPNEKMVDNARLLEFLDIGAKNHVDGMRVIPQVHKVLGVK